MAADEERTLEDSEETEMEELLHRITFDKDILCGKPIIRGLRISVEMILELLAKGATAGEILEDYPELEPDRPPGCVTLRPPPGGQRSNPGLGSCIDEV